jgi:hypothetical protein
MKFSSTSAPGVYRSAPLVSSPRFCPGDSGGPLKRAESLFERDGIQIGIGRDFLSESAESIPVWASRTRVNTHVVATRTGAPSP